MFYEEIDAGVDRTEWETHSRDLVGYVLSGALTMRFPPEGGKPGEEVTAHAGEAFYIPADVPHLIANRGKKTCKLVDLILGRGRPLY